MRSSLSFAAALLLSGCSLADGIFSRSTDPQVRVHVQADTVFVPKDSFAYIRYEIRNESDQDIYIPAYRINTPSIKRQSGDGWAMDYELVVTTEYRHPFTLGARSVFRDSLRVSPYMNPQNATYRLYTDLFATRTQRRGGTYALSDTLSAAARASNSFVVVVR